MQLLLRLICGITFLSATALNHDAIVALIQLTLLLYLLLLHLKATDAVIRTSRLLIWIVAPTLVAHALFTPGELILSEYAVPVSVEGVNTGLWFSLRFALLFLAALALSRLLGRREWYTILSGIPRIGNRLTVYILLLEHSKKEVGSVIGEAISQWRGEGGGIGRLIAGLVALPATVLAGSHSAAESVWHDWERHVGMLNREEHAWSGSAADRNVVVVVAVAMWLLMAGGEMWR